MTRRAPAGAPGATGRAAEAGAVEDRLDALVRERVRVGARFFDEEAPRIARLCHRMAERFARGGRLVAFGRSGSARSDARHVAVEFVHPVIVGKRALPAVALVPEGGPLARQADLLLRPDDIALGFGLAEGEAGETWAAMELARARGCLTVAFAPDAAEWVLAPPTDDPFVRQEVVETLYHVLWELVHVFFEHPGLLGGRAERRVHDVGASRFLYPFLGQEERDPEPVLADVARSARSKASDVGSLRVRTLREGRAELLAAAAALRETLESGGTLLAFGNGGSATDAMDVVADFREPPRDEWPARPALDLTEDTGILTALGNDVGIEEIFARQIIAYGRSGDAALALSTSGSSRNVVRALEEARRRGLRTVALLGYDGGRIREERLADHVIVAPSEHIPRIQEAQATVYHVLRELVEHPA